MRRTFAVSILIPAFAFSTDLIQFESGKAALARDVNENFMRLDTAIKNRAIKSGLDAAEASLQATDAALKGVQATIGQIQTGKANQADVDKAVGAKADTAALSDLARKQKADNESLNNALKGALTSGGLAGIRDSLTLKTDSSAFNAFIKTTESALSGKQTSLGFTPLNSAGGTISGDLTISKSLTVGSAVSAGGFQTGGDVTAPRGRFDTVFVPGGRMELYPDAEHGAIYGDKVGASGPVNYSVAWKRDGTASYLRSANQYLAVRSGADAPAFGDGTAEQTIWHSGNFSPKSMLSYGGNQGKGIFDLPSPPIGTWAYESFSGSDNSVTAPSLSPNIQVFSTGNADRGFQIAAPYDLDQYFMRRGNGAWQPWVELVHSGNIKQFTLASTGGTITGDLRITGKLTTAPGATPADYVFEPDYKLAPLSEIEAFTKANKHLPEVPSAAEMTSQGVDVAAMNMVLLKKVEELTLHAIALQKTTTEQRDLIDAQRTELLVQKARLDRLEAR